MPTENRRVAAYLPKRIDDRLEAFKVERGLKGDSLALIAILEEFFGVSQEVIHASSTSLGQRVDALESKVNNSVNVLTQRLQELSEAMKSTQSGSEPLNQLEEGFIGELKSELKSSLLIELRSELSDNLQSKPSESEYSSPPGQLSFLEIGDESPSEFIDELPKPDLFLSSDSEVDQSSKSSELPNELESESQSTSRSVSWRELKGELPPMTGENLAGRFGLANPRSLANKRAKIKHDSQSFVEWSISKDPEGKAWLYDSTLKLYHRVTQSPSSGFEDF